MELHRMSLVAGGVQVTKPTKPWTPTKTRDTNNGRSLIVDITVLERLYEHYRIFGVKPAEPNRRGRK